MSQLALSASFEYLCYGSTTNINIFNSFSAGAVFRRPNLTSTDVRLGRLKTVPALEELNSPSSQNSVCGTYDTLAAGGRIKVKIINCVFFQDLPPGEHSVLWQPRLL